LEQKAAARALGISERHLRRLLAEGDLAPIRSARDLQAARAVLRARAQRREGDRAAKLREWTRLTKEKADAAELENARERAELVATAAAREAVAAANDRVARRLLAFPERAAPLLLEIRDVAAMQNALAGLVHELLAGLVEAPCPNEDD
jgi:phage terminase Nu1 subunit (DNA packaging protein)